MPSPHKKSFAAEQLALRQKKKVSPVVWVLIGVAVIALVIGVYMMYQRMVSRGQGEAGKEVITSVAILPFENLSADEEHEHLCKGIAESIRNALTNVGDLHVSASTSSSIAKEKGYTIKEIGEKLDVQAVLEGSLQKSGSTLRIYAQLINVENDYHIWSHTIEKSFDDIFSLQDEIAQTIVQKLGVRVTSKEEAALVMRHTENVEAYKMYIQGQNNNYLMSEKGFKNAVYYFNLALEEEPNYALAYCGLARAWIIRSYFGETQPPQEIYSKARMYAQKAIDINDDLAEAHSVLGLIYTYYDWNWEEAEREFKRALQLKPYDALIHMDYSFLLSITGRHEEAVVEARQAQNLDPISGYINAHAGQALMMAGRMDEAIRELTDTINMDPNYFFSHYVLGHVYKEKTQFSEAIVEYTKATGLSGGKPHCVKNLALMKYRTGKKSEAEKIFASLKERSHHEYIPPTVFFSIAMEKGDVEEAVIWLEKAYEIHDSVLCWMILSLEDRMGSDPGYRDLLKKMNLPY